MKLSVILKAMQINSTTIGALFVVLLLSGTSFSYSDAPQAKPGVYGTLKSVKCPIVVKPGVGIGPLKLGESLNEIEKLGMDLKTVQGTKTFMIVGKYTVGVNEQDRLTLIEAELGDLPNCIYFGKRKINKMSSDQQLAKIFAKCGNDNQIKVGGSSIECDGISITTGGWGGQQKTPILKILAQTASDLVK